MFRLSRLVPVVIVTSFLCVGSMPPSVPAAAKHKDELAALTEQVAALTERVAALEARPTPPQPFLLHTSEPVAWEEITEHCPYPDSEQYCNYSVYHYRVEFDVDRPVRVLALGADTESDIHSWTYGEFYLDFYVDAQNVRNPGPTHSPATVSALADVLPGHHVVEMTTSTPCYYPHGVPPRTSLTVLVCPY
jgi:hypothetical protein